MFQARTRNEIARAESGHRERKEAKQVARRKKKEAARSSASAWAHNEQKDIREGEGGGGARVWRIIGRDALDWDFYPLPGTYPNRKEAEQAARERLCYLEAHQPTATSGGQSGIQDRVFVMRPDGTSYRFTKALPSRWKYQPLIARMVARRREGARQ